MKQISALKVGCGKFFHGEDVLSLLPDEICRLGRKALIIGGEKSLEVFCSHAGKLLLASDITSQIIEFKGECTTARAQSYANTALSGGYTVLVAVGGGKCIDTVKCASVFSSLPIITVPTSIATCVATSMVAIMYNDRGQREPAVNLKKEIDVCIADRALIAAAPRRTLASGILDSLAKYPESLHQKTIDSYKDCSLREYIQVINAKGIYDFLIHEYANVYAGPETGQLFDDMILTNLLHTSIVSGFADGSGQLAVAHATYDFMRNYNTEKSAPFLHGEIVAVGLLVQMAFNGFPKETVDEVRLAMKTMHMPCTLKELGYEPSAEHMDFYLEKLSENSNIYTDGEKVRLSEAVKQII